MNWKCDTFAEMSWHNVCSGMHRKATSIGCFKIHVNIIIIGFKIGE